ncbi:hypothetical protein CLAIMM_06734 [Cladophialophora immunda]|nr:hypothetical protein CLAIMM_06734 [Cladophialophora immunda]
MPQKSQWSVDIPIVSFPSLVLGSPDAQLSDQPCYLDAEQPEALRVTRAEFALWARRVAAGLIQAGLRPKDRVLVYSGNNVFYPVVFMGVIMAGGIVTTANPAFVARELAYQLQDSGTKFLLVAEGSLPTALDAAKMVNFKTTDMFIFDDMPLVDPGRAQGKSAVRHWKHLIATPEAGAAFRWDDGKSPEFVQRTVAILYSSGTTGVPKGVELSHYSLTANIRQLDYMFNLDPRFKADENNSRNQRMFCPLPMYHSLGLLFYSGLALYRHIPVYILKKYSLPAMLKAIQDHRITELTLVPPMVLAMAKSPESRKYDLSSVLKVQAGAAPMSRETCVEFERLWSNGQVNVKQAWGMTETPTTVLHWDERDISTTQRSVSPCPTAKSNSWPTTKSTKSHSGNEASSGCAPHRP